VLGGALAGCPAEEPAPPYALTVTATALGLTDVEVFADSTLVADAASSVPVVRDFASHAAALDSLPFALIVYHRGVTQDAFTINPGVICEGRVDVPVREELVFLVALDMGAFRLHESRYACEDEDGELWEMEF
jgi:hypothetical protein